MMDSHFVLIIVFLFLNDSSITGYTLEDNARSRSNFTPTTVTQSSIEIYSAASDEIVTSYGLSSDAIIFPDQLNTYFPNRAETSTSVTSSSEVYHPPKTRSGLKCDEYAQEIKNIIAATSTTTTTMATTTQIDMLSNKNDLPSIYIEPRKKVAGGMIVKDNEFAHMVALGRRDSDGKFVLMCGATLISHIWTLTAAHCTYGPNGSPSEARLGMNKLTDQRSGITIRIQMMIRHPDYVPPAKYADIALVKLTSSVIFDTSIRPACLYRRNETADIFNAYVTGWGATEYAGDPSDILQKALLDVIDNPSCAAQHGTSREIPRGITESMICAGDPYNEWKKDSCQGDSGSPLQVVDLRHWQLYDVLGVTSFGVGCAMKSPGVYIRVSHYLSWIEGFVWPQEQ